MSGLVGKLLLAELLCPAAHRMQNQSITNTALAKITVFKNYCCV